MATNWTNSTKQAEAWIPKQPPIPLIGATAWTSGIGNTEVWTQKLPPTAKGGPYDSDYLYDSVLSYNSGGMVYQMLWTPVVDQVTAWV